MQTSQLDFWPEEHASTRLAWSFTRSQRLKECPRKYFFCYYASRGGGSPQASAEVREIYVLKYLRNRHMWVGEVVHEMMELALSAWRRADQVPLEALVERGTRRMRAQYAESIQGVYRDRPRLACGLFEHEYAVPTLPEEWRAARDTMEQCLRTFFEIDLVQEIRQTPPWLWLAVESMASFELDGATVLVKPDFAWREEDGPVHVVDWKTGVSRPASHWQQLAVYGAYARRAWGLGDRGLVGQIAYLRTGEVEETELSSTDLEEAEETLRSSIREMRQLNCQASRVTSLDPDTFPQTDDISRCARCPFKRPCGR